MRAAVTQRPGGPIPVVEIPDPAPAQGEALVQVKAASVNRLDRMVFDGAGLGRAAAFPLIQGIDAAGVVVAGEGFEAGTPVVAKPAEACGVCGPCGAGRDADCAAVSIMGIHRPGGFAELVAVPEANLVPTPPALAFGQAAAAAHVHPVVLRMLRAAEVQPGETVLVTGAAGAIGLAGVQLGVALGARVVATCSTEEKASVVRNLGATVFTSRDGALAAELSEIDVVVDGTGDPGVLGPALSALAVGGRLVVVGTHGGGKLEVDLGVMYRRRQRIIGSAGSSRADFADAYRLIAEHAIEPMVSDTISLDEVEKGMEMVLDRSRVGKVVVAIG